MSNPRHRNKSNSADNSSQTAANDVAKKSNKSSKGSSSSSSSGAASGVFKKLFTFVLYAGLIAVSACTGWFVYNLLEEVSQINSKLSHLSLQKGELAETVNNLQKQVEILHKTVGRVEFISKDIQEKQLLHDTSIKKSEKELDQVGVILKKLQKDLSNVIQDVTAQGDRDLIQFEKTMSEKFTELNNSINEDIIEITKVQKSCQDEINNVKAKLTSLGEFDSIKDELRLLKDVTSQLQTSYTAKEASIEWLMNNALNVESITANTNEIALIRLEHDDFKKDLEAQVTKIEDIKEKILKIEDSDVKSALERLDNEFDQISSSVAEMENNYVSANNDLLKEIKINRDDFELRLGPLESLMETVKGSQQLETIESFKTSFDEYNRRLNAVEEAYSGLKISASSGDAETSETLSSIQESQQNLSKDVDELKSIVAQIPVKASEFERLQVEVTNMLEGHRSQIEDLKDNYDQWKSSIDELRSKVSTSDNSEQVSSDALSSSVNKLETDLKMLRTAVDSLVAYSVKIETNEKELGSMKESLEDLKQSTDRLLVKLEQIQEAV
ncbi:cytoskeleton-associated protein 4 [Pelobates fuscus]|uniref:cytoskeleton-associated protein 4 n=1 Tax=Pelobates fuscus TaxID=191477 RepID=UPI002FE4ED92